MMINVNATLYWAFLDRQNEMTTKYQVDVAQLSSAAVSALLNMGIKVQNRGDERGSFLTVKSQGLFRVEFECPEVPLDQIGNGTKANVYLTFYDWEFRGHKGRSPSAKKIVINDVVRANLNASHDDDFDIPAI